MTLLIVLSALAGVGIGYVLGRLTPPVVTTRTRVIRGPHESAFVDWNVEREELP